MWDYAPSFPTNLMTGVDFTDDQKVFVEEGIGRSYLKSVYQECTSDYNVIERSPEEMANLGLLGPIIRAEVGDTITVHFKNNTRFPASIHPHGVFYTKSSEGANYDDGTAGGDVVAPMGEYTYTWLVPERAGPAENDPSSIVWPYHSHNNTTADTNSGLIGAIIITRKGMARGDGSPKDVNREFVTLFNIYNENVSNYLDDNLPFCTSGSCTEGAEDFEEQNLMHSMNGFLWGNNTYTMYKGERVRWHVFAMGTEVDLHTPHWHGATLVQYGIRVDTTEILPAATKTLTFRPDVAGTWMYHCHVNDHIDAGMMTVFTVLE